MELVIPISALEHHVYCPRQAAIIHVDGVWFDNAHTVRGRRGHKRVDTAPSRVERGRRVLRGIPLWSERLGLTGRADVVEVLPDGSVEPVEYKHGTRHGRAAEVQLCAQGLCLEEMLGIEIRFGFVWYAGHRRREQVALDEDLRQLTLTTILEIRSAFDSDGLPQPVNDQRCEECQLEHYCKPALVADPGEVTLYVSEEVLRCS